MSLFFGNTVNQPIHNSTVWQWQICHSKFITICHVGILRAVWYCYWLKDKSTEGPRLTRILGLEKTTLREFCVSGTVGDLLLLTQKSPT